MSNLVKLTVQTPDQIRWRTGQAGDDQDRWASKPYYYYLANTVGREPDRTIPM